MRIEETIHTIKKRNIYRFFFKRIRHFYLLTIIIMQFIKIGTENTTDIKSPLESKYCCLENNLLKSNKYIISNTYQNNMIILSNLKILTSS